MSTGNTGGGFAANKPVFSFTGKASAPAGDGHSKAEKDEEAKTQEDILSAPGTPSRHKKSGKNVRAASMKIAPKELSGGGDCDHGTLLHLCISF
jgi:hypothetical protein